MESLQITPTAMNADASVRLTTFADYDSGWIAVTNHEGFVVELNHRLSRKPVQLFVLFSPDFVQSYSLSGVDAITGRRHAIDIDADLRKITLVSKTGYVLRCKTNREDIDYQRWYFGFIRVLANV